LAETDNYKTDLNFTV